MSCLQDMSSNPKKQRRDTQIDTCHHLTLPLCCNCAAKAGPCRFQNVRVSIDAEGPVFDLSVHSQQTPSLTFINWSPARTGDDILKIKV